MIANSTTTTTTCVAINCTTSPRQSLDLHQIRDKMKTPKCAKSTTIIIINFITIIMQFVATTTATTHTTTTTTQLILNILQLRLNMNHLQGATSQPVRQSNPWLAGPWIKPTPLPGQRMFFDRQAIAKVVHH